MAENAALAAAITALSNAIANFHPPAAPAHHAVFDPFAADQPFDLTTRQGAQAYNEASSPLDEIWDGSVNTFPSFIVNLQIRAQEAKWNSTAPHDIITVNGNNILTNYHSVTDADLTAARTARVDNRAIQNTTTMFKCIKASISGSVKQTIFTQSGNLPTHTCGVTLFKKLTTLTSISSLQLSLLAFSNILEFNPVDYKFEVPTINTKLTQLFTLATTQHRTLNELERIQHVLNVYSKIMQPELWAQWVRNKIDEFEDGTITNAQDFMNSATIKYNKVIATSGGTFKGSIHTVQEDIVALLSTKSKFKPNKRKRENSDNDKNEDSDRQPNKNATREKPDFIYHYKDGTTNQKYKVGDKKDFNGQTFYFCDAPWHKNKIKWHTHTADTCRVRKNWMKQKSKKDDDEKEKGKDDAEINLANSDDASESETDLSSNSTDVTALLASAMNLVPDNVAVRDQIAEALNLIGDM